MGTDWAPVDPPDYLRAQRDAVVLRDWETLLFLNHAWHDPHAVLEAPRDGGAVLRGIWRARCLDGAGNGCPLTRMWIMLVGHAEAV